MFGRRRRQRSRDGLDLRRVTGANTLTEAEMIGELLDAEGIPVLIRRTRGFDVPDFLSAGPRDLLVRAEDLERAHEIVVSHFGTDRPFG